MARSIRRTSHLALAALATMVLSACSMTDSTGKVDVALTGAAANGISTAVVPEQAVAPHTSLYVTFERIDLVPADGPDDEGGIEPVVDLGDPEGAPIVLWPDEGIQDTLSCDLMRLVDPGVHVPLAELVLPEGFEVAAGRYDQIRFLVVDAAIGTVAIDPVTKEPSVVDICSHERPEGTWEPVFVPSGMQSGLKVNIDPALTVAPAPEPASFSATSTHLPTVVVAFDDERLVETGGAHPYILGPTGVTATVEQE